ncbi:hypothetical protein ACFQ10_47340 [Streptomyces indonesiensis]
MTGPLRPAFHEGQVLAAADLSATVEYARGGAARHARHLHEWGIVEGLGLVTQPRTDPLTGVRHVEVSVSAGIAVDGTGREVVVTEPVVLRESDFEEVNGADQATDEPYPVFLTAADREPAEPAGPVSCSGSATKTRVEESYQILFGRLGDERLAAEQQPPAIGDPPADPPVRWLVLLGYVHWADGHFSGVETVARGVAARFAGVRADTVSARSGALTLRTGTEIQEGGLALVLTGGETPNLVFGLYQGGGAVAPLMTVAANGNLTIEGSFGGRMSAQQHAGGLRHRHRRDAAAAAVRRHPGTGRRRPGRDPRPADPAHPPLADSALFSPVEATVDADRRVRCRVRVYNPSVNWKQPVEQPGAVDFLVLATVAATNGGG